MSSTTLSPRESGKLIAENAEHISITKSGIERLGNEIIEQVRNGKLSVDLFSQTAFHPKATDTWAIDWIFVVDTLNFCFWSPEQKSGWIVNGHTGYFALCEAINRALKENIDILNPSFYSTLSREQAEHIFRSDNSVAIPLLEQRISSLHQVGSVLLDRFEGSFVNLIRKADKSASKLLKLIVEHFECFADEAVFVSQKVSFYKRAQILVGDLWACFKGDGMGEFRDIGEITMFADYRVPQSLLDFGVLSYDKELTERLKSNQILANGDEMEVEIRGCSIHAVELVKDYVNEKLSSNPTMHINAIIIDHYLWDYRRLHANEILRKGLPFHKTFCIYY